MGSRQIKPAVFFDRDGVLTANVYYPQWEEWEAPMHVEDLHLLPGAIEALSLLQEAAIPFFLISNQGAYAKGKTSLENLLAVGTMFNKYLLEHRITFMECFYSYTHPKGIVPGFSGPSLERKPGTYFLHLAAAMYCIDLSQSWLIGDRDTDILCGQQAGLKTILIADSPLDKKDKSLDPHCVVPVVKDAVNYLLEQMSFPSTSDDRFSSN